MVTRRLASIGLVMMVCGLGWAMSGCATAATPTPVTSRLKDPAAVRAADRHAALGDEYYQRQRVRDALEEWRLALELDPERPELAARVAALEQGREVPTAVPAGAIVSADPGLARQLQLAERNYRDSRLGEADSAWRSALQLDPNNAQALAGLRRLAEETYQPNPQREFDRMTESLYQEGMTAFRRGDWPTAEGKLGEAAKLNPAQSQVVRALELTRREQTRLRDQERARTLVAQAQAAEAAGQWAQAHAAWLAAAQLEPPAPGAAAGVSRTAQAMARLADAAQDAARQAEQAGRWGQARDGYARVLELDPARADAAAGLERAKARSERRDQDAAAHEQAQHHYQLGVAAYQRGELDAAAKELETAAAAQPQDPKLQAEAARVRRLAASAAEEKHRRASVRYADGLAAYQRGDLDGALAAWKETLELDPAHEKARANLHRLEQEMK